MSAKDYGTKVFIKVVSAHANLIQAIFHFGETVTFMPVNKAL
jgi:hypothetical protein